MFDICCGGVTPALKKGIHFSKAPYLKRTYPCTYCKEFSKYRWQCSYTFDELSDSLKKEIPHIGRVKDIKVLSIDEAGVVQDMKIRDESQSYTLPASKFKSCFKCMYSMCFRSKKLAIR